MTDKEMRIAIAEACGWRCEDTPFERHGTILKGGLAWWHPEIAGARFLPPDYLNDLNAIQSECRAKFRTDAEQSLFAVTLMDVVGLDPDAVADGIEMFRYATATSRQWCIAFLRTIGKWSYG